jgi:hypothetical protein
MGKILRGTLVGLVALAFVVAAGCGSDTKAANDYVEAVNTAQNDFAATFERLEGQIGKTSTPSQSRQTLGRFKTAVDKVVADLEAVQPPAKVATLHRRLVGEIASYREQIAGAQKAFSSKDPTKIIAAQAKLVTAVTQVSGAINATIDAINTKLHE